MKNARAAMFIDESVERKFTATVGLKTDDPNGSYPFTAWKGSGEAATKNQALNLAIVDLVEKVLAGPPALAEEKV